MGSKYKRCHRPKRKGTNAVDTYLTNILSWMVIGIVIGAMAHLGDNRTPEERFRYLEDRLESIPDKKERA